jgi:hypothetical protein
MPTNLADERIQRERRWLQLEIERLERLVRIGVFGRSDVDSRVVELQDRLKALSGDHPHAD